MTGTSERVSAVRHYTFVQCGTAVECSAALHRNAPVRQENGSGTAWFAGLPVDKNGRVVIHSANNYPIFSLFCKNCLLLRAQMFIKKAIYGE